MKAGVQKIFQKVFGVTPWKREWQEELNRSLAQAQEGVEANLVVVIARESDIYAEVLFLLSFLGTSLGLVGGYFLRSYYPTPTDLLLFPISGFAFGCSLFAFRRFYLTRMAGHAVRQRVSQRAKSQFYDHEQRLSGNIVLLYFSELERDALLLASKDLLRNVPTDALKKPLRELASGYVGGKPLRSLNPFLSELGSVLRRHLGGTAPKSASSLLVLGSASDKQGQSPYTRVLRGSDDLN